MRQPLMPDPWETLNLDRRTATERDVKAAYARLLKQHRPEQDPEGFQRVRQAYDAALAELRGSSETFDGSALPAMRMERNALASACDPEETAPSRQTLEELTKSVEAALQAQDAALLWDAIQSALEVDLPELEIEDVHAQVSALVRGNSDLLHKAVSRDRLLQSLESDNSSIFRFMCDHWRSTSNTSAPPVVANHVLSQKTLLVSLSGAMALADLGSLVGFRHPDLARKLADLAYKHLPAEIRDLFMGMVEREIVLGQIFFGFPPEQLKFWLPRLREPDRPWDWSGPQARAAFDYIVRARSITWAGLPLLCNLLPPAVGESLHATVLDVAQKAQDEYCYGGGILPAGVAKSANYLHYYFFVFMTIGCMTLLGLFTLFPKLREWFSEMIWR